MDYFGYTVYKDGRVLGLSKKRYMKYGKKYVENTEHFYWTIHLRINGKSKLFKLHRLLAILYLPNPDNLPVVDHIDRNRLNNDLSNLRWVTISTNAINCKLRKTNTTGYRHIYSYIRKTRGNIEYFKIQINRENKLIYHKIFSSNNHTIEDVVRYRNIAYKELNIDIDD